jgi:hypothetical protein
VVLSLHTRVQLKDKFAYAVKRQNLRIPKGCATISFLLQSQSANEMEKSLTTCHHLGRSCVRRRRRW